MEDLKDNNGGQLEPTIKAVNPGKGKGRGKAAKAVRAPKEATKIPQKLAKDYTSPLKDVWEKFVDTENDRYAFLEVELRDYNHRTGKKISNPQIISFNRSDLMTFVAKPAENARNKGANLKSMKEANDLSINAVLYVPDSFNINVEVDEWE